MPVLLLIFIVVPLIELFVIIEVGQAIGVWPTIGLLFLSAVLGSMLVRSQGRAAWRRFNEALAERRIPHREVFDGAMVIVGGTLLVTPGFVTDVFGLLLLIPPSRAAIRRVATNLLVGRIALGGRVAYWGYGRVRDRRSPGGPRADGPRTNGASPPPPRRPGPPRPYDVEGSAQEIRDEGLIDPPRRDPER